MKNLYTFIIALAFIGLSMGAAKGQGTITTISLPNGAVGVAYNETLTATGFIGIRWTISAGALPDGLTLNSVYGVISGTPTAAGTFNFTVKATEAMDGASTIKPLSITIAPPPPVCSIGAKTYASLDDALADIQTGGATATIIKLLTDITHDGGCTITNKKITFDLNGKNLVFNGTTTPGLTLSNAVIDYNRNPGTISVVSTGNDGLNISGGSCSLTYAETSASSGRNAVYCWNGGQVSLAGNVKTAGNNGGVTADGTNSSVTVTGNITSGGRGISATAGCAVTVTGNITASNNGIFAGNGAGATVTVNGNIVSSGSDGIFSNNNVTVNVTGSVSAISSGKWAILAEGGTITVGSVINSSNGVAVKNSGTNVTVDGTITATGTYIQLNSVNKTQANGVLDPAKQSYLKYSDGTSIVWVKTIGTGIETISQATGLKAWVANGTLHVSGLTAGKQWRVYSVAGVLVASPGPSKGGEEATTPLTGHGVYIVQSGNRTAKVQTVL